MSGIGTWTVEQLTPLIVSALPAFVVAYASIAHLVDVKKVSISLADLQIQAAEAQARASAQVAIIKANNMINEERATTAIGFGKTLWNKATNRGDKVDQNERITGPIVNPNAAEEVNSQQTPFDEENEQVSEQDQDTDKMSVVNISSVRKSRNNGTTKQAASRIRKALLANPDLTLSELVKKTKVSRSYASQIRSQVLSEQSEVRA